MGYLKKSVGYKDLKKIHAMGYGFIHN